MTEEAPVPAPEVEVQVSKTVPVADLTIATINAAITDNEVPQDAYIFTNGGHAYAVPRPNNTNANLPFQVTFSWVE